MLLIAGSHHRHAARVLLVDDTAVLCLLLAAGTMQHKVWPVHMFGYGTKCLSGAMPQGCNYLDMAACS